MSGIDRVSIPPLRLPANSLESNWILERSAFFRRKSSFDTRFSSRILDDPDFFFFFLLLWSLRKRHLRRHSNKFLSFGRGTKERKYGTNPNFTSSWKKNSRTDSSESANSRTRESGKRRWIEFPRWRKSGFSRFFFHPLRKISLKRYASVRLESVSKSVYSTFPSRRKFKLSTLSETIKEEERDEPW